MPSVKWKEQHKCWKAEMMELGGCNQSQEELERPSSARSLPLVHMERNGGPEKCIRAKSQKALNAKSETLDIPDRQ